ncbi:MAG: DUF262 domain-containing protein [Desulfomonilaceae bacterium]|jgi:hypothetical protein
MDDTFDEAQDDLVHLEGDDEGDLVIESKTQTVALEKFDRSLFELNRRYEKGRLIISPEWQRGYVWDHKRASLLIESFLIDLPVPVIYLATNDEGKHEVIDGLQRLKTVFRFFANEFELSKLELLKGLNNKKFKDLDVETQDKLENSTLRTFELDQSVPKELMFVIFKRLNTGGVALNETEIRNCIFPGSLNDLIKELALDPDFRACAGQKGLEKRMQDRALVMRFLAFYQYTHNHAKKGLKQFINQFLKKYQHADDADIKEYRQVFKKCMQVCLTVFGNKGFRLRTRPDNRKAGDWVSVINASIFSAVATSFAHYDRGALTRASDSIYEAYVDLISSDETWVDAVSTSTGDYRRIQYAFNTWANRLKSIMDSTPPNDSTRLFSRALKAQLFDQDSTCSICGQAINLIDDAVLDHVQQYWQGGQTVPDNARLAHRHCNLERPRKFE